jgi:hypothetical protein
LLRWPAERRVDLRYDAGLIRLKARDDQGWTDLLALPPRTCTRTPDSLGPRLVLPSGSSLVMTRGRVAHLSASEVVLDVSYGGARARYAVRLLGRGAEVTVHGRPGARYRFSIIVPEATQARRVRTGLVVGRTLHRFAPRPRRTLRTGATASAETLSSRHVVEVVAGRDGRAAWQIRLGGRV